ncbi:hypothetical protein Vretifemale_11972, partial [Volvox reticuliferus]
ENDNDEEEEEPLKSQARREKNRMAARRCRAKKIAMVQGMKEELKELFAANQDLKMQVVTWHRLFSREVKLREALKRVVLGVWSTSAAEATGFTAQEIIIKLEAGTVDLNSIFSKLQQNAPTATTIATATATAVTATAPTHGSTLPSPAASPATMTPKSPVVAETSLLVSPGGSGSVETSLQPSQPQPPLLPSSLAKPVGTFGLHHGAMQPTPLSPAPCNVPDSAGCAAATATSAAATAAAVSEPLLAVLPSWSSAPPPPPMTIGQPSPLLPPQPLLLNFPSLPSRASYKGNVTAPQSQPGTAVESATPVRSPTAQRPLQQLQTVTTAFAPASQLATAFATVAFQSPCHEWPPHTDSPRLTSPAKANGSSAATAAAAAAAAMDSSRMRPSIAFSRHTGYRGPIPATATPTPSVVAAPQPAPAPGVGYLEYGNLSSSVVKAARLGSPASPAPTMVSAIQGGAGDDAAAAADGDALFEAAHELRNLLLPLPLKDATGRNPFPPFLNVGGGGGGDVSLYAATLPRTLEDGLGNGGGGSCATAGAAIDGRGGGGGEAVTAAGCGSMRFPSLDLDAAPSNTLMALMDASLLIERNDSGGMEWLANLQEDAVSLDGAASSDCQ